MSGKSKTLSPTLLAAVAAVIGLLVGFGFSYAHFQPRLADLNKGLSSTQEKLSATEVKIEQLQSSLADVRVERSKLEALLSTTNASLSMASQELTAKRTELEGALDDLRSARERINSLDSEIALRDKEIALRDKEIDFIERALLKLDNDRKLLVYLRMDLPETRQEAVDYWNAVRNVSAQSDPSLTSSVDAIVDNLEGYFDWVEAMPEPGASPSDYGVWFLSYSLEAFGYSRAVEDFRKDVLLAVVTDIRSAVDLLS